MTHTPLLVKNDSEYLKIPPQVNSSGDFSVNYALTAVAQEIVELLKQSHPFQLDSINHTETQLLNQN